MGLMKARRMCLCLFISRTGIYDAFPCLETIAAGTADIFGRDKPLAIPTCKPVSCQYLREPTKDLYGFREASNVLLVGAKVNSHS